MIPDPVAREDVFQDVAVVLWQSFARYDPSRSFGAWARGIALRKVWEDRRKTGRLPECLSLEILESLSAAFEPQLPEVGWQAQEQALSKCLSELPKRSSQILRLRYDDNLGIEAIAVELQMRIDAVYQKLSRLRRRLRDCVTRRAGEFN